MNSVWNTFEKNKDVLKNEFKQNDYVASTGLSYEDVEKICLNIAKDNSQSRLRRKTGILKTIMEKSQLAVLPCGWFADRIDHRQMFFKVREIWIEELKQNELKDICNVQENAVEDRAFYSGEDFGHTCPDWEAILTLGVTGIIKRLEQSKENLNSQGKLTTAKNEFFETAIEVNESIRNLIGRFAVYTESLSDEFPKMAEVSNALYNLTKGAPDNILEAMQLINIYYFWQTFIEGTIVRSLGRLDELLYPFYKKDIQSGRYNKEQITELLKHFMYRFYAADIIANVPFALNGISKTESAKEDFGILILDTYASLDILSPKMHIRVCDNTKESYIKKVFSIIKSGNNSFVFTNDNVVTKALMNIGQEQQEAENYVMIGCYEPASFKKEVPCTCNGQISLPKAVEYALTGGVDLFSNNRNGLSTQIPTTYNEFINAVKLQMKYFADMAIKRVCAFEKYYMEISPSPIFSSTLEECVLNGVDAYEGGAKYNNSSICAIGIANATDSIYAIKKMVFEDKKISLQEILKALKNDWQGYQKLRCEILNLPKYGNNNEEVDEIAKNLLDYSAECINLVPNARGGVFRLGAFSIDWREFYGSVTAATADGRKKGELLSKNLSASAGADKDGVTAMISSAARLNYEKFPDGTVLDIVVHPSAVNGEKGTDALLSLVFAYFKMGGMAIQFNIFDPSVLKKAQAEPEKYSTLQVRLCGWNAYFTDLSKPVQDEFIAQAEMNL